MRKVAIGIDIGGTLTKIGLVDKEGTPLVKTEFRTKNYPNFDDFVAHTKEVTDSLINEVGDPVDILGIGVGAPNANQYRGTIEHAANLLWKGIIPFSEKFKKAFNEEIVILTNDANAAAIGERVYGNAKGMKDFIVITLGTGLGSGIVTNGKLLLGHDAVAGELGHVVIEEGGREAGTGVRGALEAYVSSTGLKRTILYMLCDSLAESRFRAIAHQDIHGEEITKAAEEGDVIAQRAFEYTGNKLGTSLANFVAFSQPEAIFLLGGLAKAGKWIIDPTLKSMEKALMPVYRGKVKVMESGMNGKNAAILGAASLVWDYLENTQDQKQTSVSV